MAYYNNVVTKEDKIDALEESITDLDIIVNDDILPSARNLLDGLKYPYHYWNGKSKEDIYEEIEELRHKLTEMRSTLTDIRKAIHSA